VEFQAVEGSEYRIAVDGSRYPAGRAAEGSIRRNWFSGPPPNARFEAAQVLEGATGAATGWNAFASKEDEEPDHAENAGGQSVWYRWRATTAGSVSFSTDGSTFDTLLAVYVGKAVDALEPIAANDDDRSDSRTSAVTFEAAKDVEYRIAVDGYRTAEGAASVGTIALGWRLSPRE
jgi:hypothetical protein